MGERARVRGDKKKLLATSIAATDQIKKAGQC